MPTHTAWPSQTSSILLAHRDLRSIVRKILKYDHSVRDRRTGNSSSGGSGSSSKSSYRVSVKSPNSMRSTVAIRSLAKELGVPKNMVREAFERVAKQQQSDGADDRFSKSSMTKIGMYVSGAAKQDWVRERVGGSVGARNTWRI